MLKNTKYPLVRNSIEGHGVYHQTLSEQASWKYLNMEARRMKLGEVWEGDTGDFEYGIILLSGNYAIQTNRGNWETVNGRKSVFHGMPHTLYLPAHTSFSLTSTAALLDIAYAWVMPKEVFPAKFKTPDQVAIEIRGGDNATRQINSLIEPGFGASRIVAVEVYTPAGNWSSYPAHKHDERILDENGRLIEANLEEIYFYKIQDPAGFAIQQVYTADKTLDEVMKVHNNDAVLVPKGYHPVVAGHAYDCYYLNFLAGSDQSLANTPDPNQEWIFNSWKSVDPRVPMVDANMNRNH